MYLMRYNRKEKSNMEDITHTLLPFGMKAVTVVFMWDWVVCVSNYSPLAKISSTGGAVLAKLSSAWALLPISDNDKLKIK